VIVEPIELEFTDERKKWLLELRKLCTEKGIALIFDEVITGFRVPRYTVSTYYDIKPDIICLGKGIANGLPLSVVAGSKEIMDSAEYFISSTFSGETLSLAAAQATMGVLETKESLDDVCYYGNRLRYKIDTISKEISLKGYGTRAELNVENPYTQLFMQEACKAGILLGKAWFFNVAHLKENFEERMMNIFTDINIRIRSGAVKLMGLPPRPTFERVKHLVGAS